MDKHNLFDQAICDKKLQIMKTALPYINPREQKLLSLFIISEEMKNTVNFYKDNNNDCIGICSIENEKRTSQNMINDIKNILSDKECEKLDNILNFINLFSIAKLYKNTPNDSLQQEILDMYSTILQGQAT